LTLPPCARNVPSAHESRSRGGCHGQTRRSLERPARAPRHLVAGLAGRRQEEDPCASPPPGAIVGTTGNDVLRGTPGPDFIVAGDGNDVILGLGGDDFICAGLGNDKVVTGAGNDVVAADDFGFFPPAVHLTQETPNRPRRAATTW
jgi:hypothetical protein